MMQEHEGLGFPLNHLSVDVAEIEATALEKGWEETLDNLYSEDEDDDDDDPACSLLDLAECVVWPFSIEQFELNHESGRQPGRQPVRQAPASPSGMMPQCVFPWCHSNRIRCKCR